MSPLLLPPSPGPLHPSRSNFNQDPDLAFSRVGPRCSSYACLHFGPFATPSHVLLHAPLRVPLFAWHGDLRCPCRFPPLGCPSLPLALSRYRVVPRTRPSGLTGPIGLRRSPRSSICFFRRLRMSRPSSSRRHPVAHRTPVGSRARLLWIGVGGEGPSRVFSTWPPTPLGSLFVYAGSNSFDP